MKVLGICGAIVSFNPPPEIVENVRLLREQVDDVIVVDNDSSEKGRIVLERLEQAGTCTVIYNGRNLGIAGGLNVAIQYASRAGHEWIVMFDHDSRVTPGFMTSMVNTYQKCEYKEKVGIIAPVWKDVNSCAPPFVSRSHEILSVINSGSLVRLSTFEEHGLFDENLFMDYVDSEFCLRLRSRGLKILQSNESVLLHRLGTLSYHTRWFRPFYTTNHSAERRYYITRNRCVLIWNYLSFDPRWVWHDAYAMLKETVKILLVEKDKLAKLRNIVFGTADAITGRMGARVVLRPEQNNGGNPA